MILADTSAWVEYDRATGSTVHLRLRVLLRETRELGVTEPVVMEVLIGARTNEREEQLRRLLGRGRLLPFDPGVDFNAAVHIYRTCRRAGVTPRGLVDCLIAAVAMRHRATLLTADRDLAAIGSVMALELDPACPA